MKLNKNGMIVENAWHDLPDHYAHVELCTFVIMPNHFHGIIILKDNSVVGAGLRPAPTTMTEPTTTPTPITTPIKRHGLSEIVRALKSFSARRINEHLDSPGVPVWQRNYYDHIIRKDDDLNRIHQYIQHNPAHWDTDLENPISNAN